jgi:hypothetical protein
VAKWVGVKLPACAGYRAKLLPMIVISWITTTPFNPANAALICLEPLAGSFEQEYARATAVLPPTTKDMNNISIYAERAHDGTLYFHSNFIAEGSNPTKLASVTDREGRDILAVWENIVFPRGKDTFTDAEKDAVLSAFSRTRLIVDSNLFNKDGRLPFDTGEIGSLSSVDHGGQESLPAVPIHTTGSPPPAWIVRVHGCCMYVKLPAKAAGLMGRLAAVPFSNNQTSFVSLVIDSATERAIAGSGLAKKAVSIDFAGDIRRQVEDAFHKSSGKTLAILGHVEDGSFVVYSSKSVELTRIRISDLDRMAKDNDVSLVEAGCNTANEISQESASLVRVANQFRATDAVRLLDSAFRSSSTYAEFLDQLSSPEFLTVIDENALRSAGALHMKVYQGTGSDDSNALTVGMVALRLNAANQIAANSVNAGDDTQVQYDRKKQVREAAIRILQQKGEWNAAAAARLEQMLAHDTGQ